MGTVALATLAGLPLLLVGTTAVTASAAPAPITIAYITDLTGEGGSQNGTSPAGFNARIAMQNAQGGVNGHKIVPIVIDDQTNPSEIATAVQSAMSKGAFGIVSQSPLMFLAAKYPQQAGMPVTGTYDDGPEWGQQPYTNMFAADLGSVDPKYRSTHSWATSSRSSAGRCSGPTATASRRRRAGPPSAPRNPSSTRAARSACSTPRCPSAASTSPARLWWPRRTG
jgi:hypothetical protein